MSTCQYLFCKTNLNSSFFTSVMLPTIEHAVYIYTSVNIDDDQGVYLRVFVNCDFCFHSRFKIQATRLDETDESMQEYYPWVPEEKQPDNNEWYFEMNRTDTKQPIIEIPTTIDISYLLDPVNNFCDDGEHVTFMFCYSASRDAIPIEGYVLK